LLSALGPAPVVNSAAGLLSLAHQMHVLTTPLPTVSAHLQLSALEDSVQTALARMDDFSALAEALKHATSHSQTQLWPLMQQRQVGLEQLFRQIHTFEKYTRELEKNVQYAEGRVEQVESILKKTAAMGKKRHE
jgi:hypothetical protein